MEYNIITEASCIRINDSLIPKSKYTVTKLVNGVRACEMDIDYTRAKINGVQVTSVDALFDFFKENGFSNGGGATGEGVVYGTATASSGGDFSVVFPEGKYSSPPHVQLTAIVVGDAMTRCVAIVNGTLTKDGFSGEVFDGQGTFHSGEVLWLAIG